MTWLLEVDLYGRTLRYSIEQETVTDGSTTYTYETGLITDPQIGAGDERVGISLALGPEATPSTVAAEVEGATVRLLRWERGDAYGLAEVFVAGRVADINYAGANEPISFEIDNSLSPDSIDMPNLQAKVDSTTWPSTGGTTRPPSQEGIYYPEILGYPGHTGAATPTPVVPVPLGEWQNLGYTTSHVIVSGRPLTSCTRAYVTNLGDATHPAQWETVATMTDLLTRQVAAADFNLNNSLLPGATVYDSAQFYAGFHPTYGGGNVRTAYDVIAWVLRTWAGSTRVDWNRVPEVQGLLSAYLVDHWFNDPSKPWDWIQAVLLPFLPVVIREGRNGRYFERQRYLGNARDAIGDISADRGDCDRRSAVRFTGSADIVNEVTVDYQRGTTGLWAARRTYTAQGGRLTNPYGADLGNDVRIVGHPIAALSQGRYGLRTSDPVQIPWVWDTGTALTIAQDVLERRAFPTRTAIYGVKDGGDLRAGDVLLLSDSEVGLSSAVAIVTASPVVGPEGTVVTLRMPLL